MTIPEQIPTKEEVENYIGYPISEYKTTKSRHPLNEKNVIVVQGLVVGQEDPIVACSFSFMIDDDDTKTLHPMWKTLALDRIKYRVQDFMDERINSGAASTEN